MATIKIACPRCGQKVSGDESFSGAIVECPICSSKIKFPSGKENFTNPTGSQETPLSTEPNGMREETALPANSPKEPAQGDSLPENNTPAIPPQDSAGVPLTSPGWEDGDEEIPSPLFGAISLVCGILGVVTCGLAAPLCAPLAIIFGHTALAKGKHSPLQPPPGKTLAVTGLVIGYVSLLVAILLLTAFAFFRQPLSEAFHRAFPS